MSFGEIKATINSDLSKTLDKLINEKGEENSKINNEIKKLITNLIVGGYQLFKYDGEFVVPEGINTIYISAIGSGGGGASGGASVRPTNTSSYYVGTGGGGGGSGYSCKDVAKKVTSGQKIPITIGSAGTGGDGTNYDSYSKFSSAGRDEGFVENYIYIYGHGNNGTAGGSAVVGDLITLQGGTGGSFGYSKTSSGNLGGAGGKGSKDGEDGGVPSPTGTYSNTTSPGTYGKGGTETNVFKGAYGRGGSGSSGASPVVTQNVIQQSSKATDGSKGAVLITWGGYRHDDVF